MAQMAVDQAQLERVRRQKEYKAAEAAFRAAAGDPQDLAAGAPTADPAAKGQCN